MTARVVGTGVGSMPGVDFRDALETVFREASVLPFFPELPARGPGADLIGRTAGMLVGLPVDLQPDGWRLVSRAGADARRTRNMHRGDADELAEFIGRSEPGFAGGFKIQLAGPWTLAASLKLPRGNAVLTDAGALRDLVESLAAGLVEQLRHLALAAPEASLVLQLDEPSLPTVLAGRVPSASGLSTIAAVDPQMVLGALRTMVTAGKKYAAVVTHCCAAQVPASLLRAAGFDAMSIDIGIAGTGDELAEVLDAGVAIWPGVISGRDDSGELSSVSRTVTAVKNWYSELGFQVPPAVAAAIPEVAVTPTCGLAGASTGYAPQALRHCAQAAQHLATEWGMEAK